MQDFAQTLHDANAVSVDFLKIEVETGLMYAGIALNADSEEKIVRNRANARTAYDTVLRYIGRVSFTPHESQILDIKMATLKSRLQALGESF